jgi:hypothetical protein
MVQCVEAPGREENEYIKETAPDDGRPKPAQYHIAKENGDGSSPKATGKRK